MSAQKAEVIENLPATTQATAITPMDMIERAMASGANVDVLAKLMDLQERYERSQARKAFDEAVAAAKADIPPIVRNRQGHNNKSYADFAAIARVVDPIITRHGLSYRFRTEQGERISVTCVLSHRAGHFEETTLSGPADTTGNKNAIQAIGSTLTYLQRYSLVQALGLAAADDDDGSAAGAGEMITDEQADTIRSLITETKADLTRFLAHLKVPSVSDIPAKMFQRAVDALEAKRAKA